MDEAEDQYTFLLTAAEFVRKLGAYTNDYPPKIRLEDRKGIIIHWQPKDQMYPIFAVAFQISTPEILVAERFYDEQEMDTRTVSFDEAIEFVLKHIKALEG